MKIFDAGQLRILRRNSGLTLRKAAKALNLSASCLADKENGCVRVFADELPDISRLFNVNIESFFVEKSN